MNQKNTLGLDYCFGDLENPTDLFKEWFNEAKKTEINDPNAFSLETCDKKGVPSVRIVLLKDFSNNGLVFYTNLNSKKSNDIKENPNGSICFPSIEIVPSSFTITSLSSCTIVSVFI